MQMHQLLLLLLQELSLERPRLAISANKLEPLDDLQGPWAHGPLPVPKQAAGMNAAADASH